MVRFSYSARTAFFTTILLQGSTTPTTTTTSSCDAFVVLPTAMRGSKSPWTTTMQSAPTSSSQRRLQLNANPRPPDSPPPSAYFAEQQESSSDDDDKNDNKEEKKDTTTTPTTDTDATATSTTPVMADPPTPLYSEEDLEEFKRFSNELGQKAVEYVFKPIVDIQKGVPSERIKGAAITGAIVGLLASKGIVVTSAAGLSAAYLAISKGVAGDVLRTVGGIAWDVTDTAARLLSIVANNEKLNRLPRGLAQKTMQALRKNSQVSARYLDSVTDATEMEAAERAFLESQEDLARVLEEAEAVIGEADQAIANAMALEDEMAEEKEEQEAIDVSIPYDAAARLAYENSDLTIPFATFKSRFVADAVELVKSKQSARVEENDEAAAEVKRKAEEKEEAARMKAEEEEETKRKAEEEKEAARMKAKEEEEIKRKAEEEEKEAARMKAMKEEEEIKRNAEEEEKEAARMKAKEEEEIKRKAEEEEEAARMKAMEEEDEDYEEFMDEDDFLAAVEMAQEGLEGKIVGIEDAIADTSAKAEWDAAGSRARELQQDDDDDDIFLDSDAFEGLDLKALGEAARKAVDLFDKLDDDDQEEELAEVEGQDWSSMTVNDLRTELKNSGLSTLGKKADLIGRLKEFGSETGLGEDKEDDDEDFDDFEDDDDDDDIEEIELSASDIADLGRQAREAVQMFQSGGAASHLDDEEPTAEMLAELEKEMSINGEASTDFNDMTVTQLKDECRNRGLKVSGKKAELIERLQETVG